MSRWIPFVALAALAFLFGPVTPPAFAADAVAAPSAPDYWALFQTYVMTPAAISGLCGFFMAILPPGAAGTPWGFVRMALDFIASNWGNAKNAPAKS